MVLENNVMRFFVHAVRLLLGRVKVDMFAQYALNVSIGDLLATSMDKQSHSNT